MLKKTEDKLICQLCKQPITGSYTTYTYITEGVNETGRLILCDCCNTEFKQLMDIEEEPL